MIPFQQILDTTRTSGEVCCPGDKYWYANTRGTYCAQGMSAGMNQTELTGGLNWAAPGMRIDPVDGSYNFHAGNDTYHYHFMTGCQLMFRGAARFNRNGRIVDPCYGLKPLTDAYCDQCGCIVQRWLQRNRYAAANSQIITDMRCGSGAYACCYSGPQPGPSGCGSSHRFWCTPNSVVDAVGYCWAGAYSNSYINFFVNPVYIKEGDIPATSYMSYAGVAADQPNGMWPRNACNAPSNVMAWRSGVQLFGPEEKPHLLQYGMKMNNCCCCDAKWCSFMYVMAEAMHPQTAHDNFWNNSRAISCHHRSVYYVPLPGSCGSGSYCERTLVNKPQQTSTVVRKPYDLRSADDGVYLSIVSMQTGRFNADTSYGLSPLFCIVCDEKMTACNFCKYTRPSGIVWKMDLPTYDTTSDACLGSCASNFCWSGKTWYMHNDEIVGKCTQLTVRDLYFRDDKIVVKPITYAGWQECFCCFNGATAHATVVFCECNCDVRYLSFTSLSTNSPAVTDMIYTTRGTWVTATPTYNASWSQDPSLCACPAKAYGALTLAEWNEDWTQCLGAVDICSANIGNYNGYVVGGMCCVGRRNYKCDSAMMADFSLDYDFIDDSILVSWSGAGSCCCYSGSQGQPGGMHVMKLPSEISLVRDWACERMKETSLCSCCSATTWRCDNNNDCGCLTCYFPEAQNSLYNCFVRICCQCIKCAPDSQGWIGCRLSLGAGSSNGMNCQLVYLSPSNNPIVSVTCTVMECCTLDPNIWLKGNGSCCWCCGRASSSTYTYHCGGSGASCGCFGYCSTFYQSSSECSGCYSGICRCCTRYSSFSTAQCMPNNFLMSRTKGCTGFTGGVGMDPVGGGNQCQVDNGAQGHPLSNYSTNLTICDYS